MTRRQLAKWISSAGLAIVMGFTSMGVSCTTVVNDIMKYIPVALQALGAILSVLSGGGIVIAPVVGIALSLAKAAFADLSADISAYENAPATEKTTLLGKVSTALAIVEGNIQQFWSDLKLPDGNISSVVSGVLGVILSTLGAFATQLPAPTPTPALEEMRTRRAANKNLLAAPPKKRTLAQFKADLNTALAGKATIY